MMKHLDDITIIEYTAGNLGQEDEQLVRGHIALCPECMAKVKDFESRWDILGHAEAAPLDMDMTAAIHERIARAGRGGVSWRGFAFKAAAIVLFGMLLGYLAASRYEQKTPSDNAVPEYMSSLSLGYSTELAWAGMETGFDAGGH